MSSNNTHLNEDVKLLIAMAERLGYGPLAAYIRMAPACLLQPRGKGRNSRSSSDESDLYIIKDDGEAIRERMRLRREKERLERQKRDQQ